MISYTYDFYLHQIFNELLLKSYSVLSIYHYGGAEENRTPDPLRAKQVLSQLSYGPG